MVKMNLIYIFIICITGYAHVEAEGPVVIFTTGAVEGYYKKTPTGKLYNAFEGIPYAKPPTGNYRFKAPQKLKTFNGTWQAKKLTKCMEYYPHVNTTVSVEGEEDCLHLNVYSPPLNGTLKPVIVFIHGGAFMFNNGGKYGEKYLMNYDVVYVSLNYRLGPLGFLSTESKILPGNNGLKDQLMALKWIKKNIRYFGGNPDSIMLSGIGAGGASVHIHTLSSKNQDKKLFHKAHAMSGTALNPWALTENSRQKTEHLASIVNCTSKTIEEMIQCMKNCPASEIVAAVKHFQPWKYNPFTPFGVVIDKFSKNPILPKHPYKLLKEGKIQNIPIIFSNVESEGLILGAEFDRADILQEIDSRWNDIIPFILDYNNTVEPNNITSINDQIRKFYFNDKRINKESYMELIKVLSDRLFIVDIERAARLHAAANTESTYYYIYSYRAAHSTSDMRTENKGNFGASHGDDTSLILSSTEIPDDREKSGIMKNILSTFSKTKNDKTAIPDDREMRGIMQNIWLTFAKTGIPHIENVWWFRMSKKVEDKLDYLSIKSPSDMKMESVDYLGNRVNFWDTLPIYENEYRCTKSTKNIFYQYFLQYFVSNLQC